MSNRIWSLLAVLVLTGTGGAWASQTIAGTSSTGVHPADDNTFVTRDATASISAASFNVTGTSPSTLPHIAGVVDITAAAGSDLTIIGATGKNLLFTLQSGQSFNINTGKFTVAGDTGNTSVAGTLTSSGLLTASTGETITAGGLTVTAGDITALTSGISAASLTATGLVTTSGNITTTGAGSISSITSVSATTTVTAGTGLSVTTGNANVIAGDVQLNSVTRINNAGAATLTGLSVLGATTINVSGNAATTIGNAGATVDITSSGWSVTGAGVLTAHGLITGTLGETITGGTINLNADGVTANAVNIGSGGSTGAVTIGNATNSVALNAPTTVTGALTQTGGSVALNTGAGANTVKISADSSTGAVTIGNQATTVAVNAPTTVTGTLTTPYNSSLTVLSQPGNAIPAGNEMFAASTTISGGDGVGNATAGRTTLRGAYNGSSASGNNVRVTGSLNESSTSGTGLGAVTNEPQATGVVGLADYVKGGDAQPTDFIVGVRGAAYTSSNKTNGLNVVGVNFGGSYFHSVGGYFFPQAGGSGDVNLGSVSQVGGAENAGWKDAAFPNGTNVAVVGIAYGTPSATNLAGYFGGNVNVTGALTVGSFTGGAGSFTTLTSTGNSTIGTSSAATTNSFGTGAANTVAVANTIGSTFAGSTNAINGASTITGSLDFNGGTPAAVKNIYTQISTPAYAASLAMPFAENSSPITITGASALSAGDTVVVVPATLTPTLGLIYTGYVSSATEVTVTVVNNSGTNPQLNTALQQSLRITVFKH
ncbi:MAG TPA: hypothetical protein VKX17_25040 [Planctomycetota bacterium]|nr:hypothetical protein [Planctomycetota bacterium]